MEFSSFSLSGMLLRLLWGLGIDAPPIIYFHRPPSASTASYLAKGVKHITHPKPSTLTVRFFLSALLIAVVVSFFLPSNRVGGMLHFPTVRSHV